MNQTYMKEKPILPLLLSMALPMVISMMVNSLYNIVDQIFVGQGVGITGMAATNVAFPLVVLVNAIALMLGDGCAANISLCLGRKQQREAQTGLRQCRGHDIWNHRRGNRNWGQCGKDSVPEEERDIGGTYGKNIDFK